MAEYSYELEQEKLRRRRMLAQAISAGGQMPQGQMVGRHYVAPSPWTQLAAVGQQLTGAYLDRKTNKQEDALKERERSRLADALRNLGVTPINGAAGADKSANPGGQDPAGSGPNIPQMPTKLSPQDEQSYRNWLSKIGMTKQNGYRLDDEFTGTDYDLRGYFKKYGPADINVKGGQHLTDEFKLPNHETFSDQSIYAVGPNASKAGRWDGEKYIPPSAAPQNTTLSVDPRREAALAVLRDLPIEAQRQIIGQQAMGQLFPKPKKLGNVDLGDQVGVMDEETGEIVKRIPKGQLPPQPTDDQREYKAAVDQGYKGTIQDWILQNKKAGASQVNVNTEKSLYGGLADERAKGLSALYQSAQAAPMTIERADRIKQLLKTVPYTGAAAEWKLSLGKAAKAAGFDYAGDDIANTELLARELGQNVLDSVKTSGLAGSQGLTEGERKFLLQIVGGTVALDDKTLARVADLNQRMAKNTMQRWNAEAGRLDPNQLRTLGMTTIEMPPDTPASGAQPKLIKNPDGSYTYQP